MSAFRGACGWMMMCGWMIVLCAGCPGPSDRRNPTDNSPTQMAPPAGGDASVTDGAGSPADQNDADTMSPPPDSNANSADTGGAPANPDVPPPACTLASAPFAEGELWIIGTAAAAGGPIAVNLVGQGGTIARVEVITDPVRRDGCRADQPDGMVSFDGRTLVLTSAFRDAGSAASCSIEVNASVTTCGPGSLAGYPANVFQISGTGTATVGDREFPISGLEITRLLRLDAVPCDGPPAGLAGRKWNLSSSDPNTLAPTTPTQGVLIEASGFGDCTEYGDAYSVDEAGVYCDLSRATVRFDGQTLTLSGEGAPLPGPDGAASPGCALSFSGTVAVCGSLAPFAGVLDGAGTFPGGFSGGVSGQFLRIKGTGTLTSGDTHVALHTLFLTTAEPRMPSTDMCAATPAALTDDEEWQITTTDPFARGCDVTPSLFILYGQGRMAESYYPISPDAASPNTAPACFGSNLADVISFDGQRLTISVNVEGNQSPCSVSFTGTLAACQTWFDETVFYSGEEVPLLRFDGVGMQTADETAMAFSSVYFVRSPADAGGRGTLVP